MAAPIEIPIASETKAFRMGVESGIIDPLEDAEKALKDLAKAGDRAGDELDDAMRGAQQETKDAKREIEKTADALEQAARSSRKFGSDTKEATSQAGRDMAELKDEALQNTSETFSSFDGSIDSLVDGIQGTFGGVVSNMGPIGAAMGAALALGIGLAVAKGEELAEAINTAKERAAELAAEIIDADGDLSQIQWAEKVTEWGLALEDSREWWEFWQEDAKTAMEVAAEYADKTGVSLEQLALGLSGMDADQATRTIEELTRQLEDLRAEANTHQGQVVGPQRQNLLNEISLREDLIGKLEQQGGVMEDATEQAEIMRGITEQVAAADEAAARATEQRTDAITSLQGELDEAVDGWAEFIDAETGATDPSAYLSAMQARMDATANFNTNVQQLADQFGLTQDEVQSILDQGVDFAPMLQSIIDSGMGEQYATQIRAMLDGGQAILDGTPTTATITTKAETSDARIVLDNTAEDRIATVEADADTTAADAALTSFVNRGRTATITAAVSTAAADRALTAWLARTRTMTVTVDTKDREGNPIL